MVVLGEFMVIEDKHVSLRECSMRSGFLALLSLIKSFSTWAGFAVKLLGVPVGSFRRASTGIGPLGEEGFTDGRFIVEFGAIRTRLALSSSIVVDRSGIRAFHSFAVVGCQIKGLSSRTLL